MIVAMNIVNGFLFGVGLILAAGAMRIALHMTVCG